MTRKRWRLLLIAAGGALAIYVIVGVILAGINTPPEPPQNGPIVLRGGNVRGGSHTISTHAWTLSYDRGEFSNDGTIGTLDGVHDGIIYKNAKPYVEIDARHVALNTETLDFTAIGKVHIQMLHDVFQRSFDTDYVTWTNDAKLLDMIHTSYLHVGGQTLKISTISVDFTTNQIHLGRIDGAVDIP